MDDIEQDNLRRWATQVTVTETESTGPVSEMMVTLAGDAKS